MDASGNKDAPASESTRLLSSNEVKANENGTKENGVEIKNPSLAIYALSLSLLVHSFLLVSVFPYSGFLAMHLVPSLNEENTGSYAGMISSAFMFGRAISSFAWGKAADKYGRIFVLKMSLFLSAIFSILFGLAPTFSAAMIVRFLLGMSNGLLGTVKTLVSEYARGDQALETHMMAIILGMWGFGYLINPAISGYLSDPVKQYPDSEFVNIFSPVLEEFPFLLPNVVGCLYCLVSYVLIHNFVEETLPEEKRQQFRLLDTCSTIIRNVSSWALPSPSEDKDGHQTESGEDEETTIYSLMKRKSVREHLLMFWFYSFIGISIDEVFPLYCMSKTSGLGITEKTIGKILSGTGFCYVSLQYLLTTKLVDRYGFYKSLVIASFLSLPLCALIPISLITNQGAAEGTLKLTTLLFLSVNIGTMRSFSSVVFSTISMTSNRTVPDTERATMNGLSMLGGSFAKALGPLLGGILFSTSVGHVTPPFGSVVVYGVIAALGFGLGVQACFLREYEGHEEKPTKIAEGESAHPDFETATEASPTV